MKMSLSRFTKSVLRRVGVIASCALTPSAMAAGVESSWLGQPGVPVGNWSDPANWSSGVPSGGDAHFMSTSDTNQIHVSGTEATNDLLFDIGDWTLNIAPGSVLQTNSRLILASHDATNANLTVQGGGLMHTEWITHLANGDDSPVSTAACSVTVKGLGTSWTTNSYVDLGWNGAGIVRVQDSATFSAAEVLLIGISGTSHGRLEVTGGSTASCGGGWWGNAAAVLGRDSVTSTGTALVAGNGSKWAVEGDLVVGNIGTGLLDVTDFGKVVVHGMLWVGPQGRINLTAGGLLAAGDGTYPADLVPTGGLYISSGQFLGGSGTINGFAFNDGVVSPGHSTGTLTIDGNFRNGLTGQLDMELTGLARDSLVVSGGVQLDGGLLVLKFLDGYAPKTGDTFDLIDCSGALTGDFGELRIEGLLDGWQYHVATSDGTLTIVSDSNGVSSIPEPAGLALLVMAFLLPRSRK